MYFISLFLSALPLLTTCVVSNSNLELMSRDSAMEFFNVLTQNKIDLAQPMRKIIPDIAKIPTRAVESCYEHRFRNKELHLFNDSATLFDVLYHYYLTQPQKKPSLESIQNLIHSVQTIVEHVHDCSNENRNYKLGFTELSDLSETEFRRRLGVNILNKEGKAPKTSGNDSKVESGAGNLNFTVDSLTRQNGQGDTECFPPSTYSPPASFDFRAHGSVTSVKNQGSCGSCWTFSTAGAIESAYLIRRQQSLDLSEQQLVDCAYWLGMGGCSAGTSFQGYSYVAQNGITSESNNPYRGYPFTCGSQLTVAASIRKFCIRGQNNYGPPTMMENLSEQAIVAALGYFGPLGVYINADRLQNYRSGIFSDPNCSKQVNHAVLLVGYTESSFIIKNSWGTNWGDNGYFQLARGSNMCGVNFEINFPLL